RRRTRRARVADAHPARRVVVARALALQRVLLLARVPGVRCGCGVRGCGVPPCDHRAGGGRARRVGALRCLGGRRPARSRRDLGRGALQGRGRRHRVPHRRVHPGHVDRHVLRVASRFLAGRGEGERGGGRAGRGDGRRFRRAAVGQGVGMTAVTIHWEAPAKVNLRLVVLAREASGFHQLETIFCAIDLADTITAQRAEPGIELEVVGARLGEPQENLVWRAASAFFRTSGIAGGARLRLDKRIPVGAGLGGGSSDAASTLHALNALYGRPLGPRSILELAAELGSDVPFFAAGRPFALAWGRGGRLLPFPALPPAPTVVGVPDFSIATVYAYGE